MPKLGISSGGAALVALLSLSQVTRAQAPEQPESPPPAVDERQQLRYQALIEEAVAEFEAGRFLEARALFRAAHGVLPNARTLRGIGVTSFELRAYDDAYIHLVAALASTERPLTETQRMEVTTLVERASRLVARYSVSELPEGTRVLIDGAPASVLPDGLVILALGRHELEIREGDRAGRATINVAGGESGPLPVDFPVPSAERVQTQSPVVVPPRGPSERTLRARRIARIALPVGGAVIATSALAFVLGSASADDVENAPEGTTWGSLSDERAQARRRIHGGYAALGIGLGFSALGTVFAIRGSRDEDDGPRAELRVGPTYLGTEVVW